MIPVDRSTENWSHSPGPPGAPQSPAVEDLADRLQRDNHQRNLRGGLTYRLRDWVSDSLGALVPGIGLARRRTERGRSEHLEPPAGDLNQLDWLHSQFADDHSRHVLDELLSPGECAVYSGARPKDRTAYREKQEIRDREHLVERGSEASGLPYLNRYQFNGLTGRLTVQTHEYNMLHTFLLEAYAYAHGSTVIRARPGDVVLDCGSGWGDSVLYFADLVGPGGHVYALEPSASASAVSADNIRINPRLRDRVTLITRESRTGRNHHSINFLAGDSIAEIYADTWDVFLERSAPMMIDEFVKAQNMTRVDFIKVDADGMELELLHYAKSTIRKYRPSMAVSLSQGGHDIGKIPSLIDEIVSDYDFFLDDVSASGRGGMLFARSRLRKSRR